MLYSYWTQDIKTDTTDTHAFNMHICVGCTEKKYYTIYLKRLFGFSQSQRKEVSDNCHCVVYLEY